MRFIRVCLLYGFLIILLVGLSRSQGKKKSKNPGGGPGLSSYFKTKHVVQQGHVRRQMLSKKIPDARKEQIIDKYMKKPFKARPNPANPAEKKPWRNALGGKSGTTLLLAHPKVISGKVGKGKKNGVDSNGNPVIEGKGKIPMVKVKTKFPKGQPSKTSFVNDGKPAVRYDKFKVSTNRQNGKINHFESLGKGGR